MGAAGPAQSQDYPTKPVTFITPAAAGNSPDVATRIVADRLTQIWKQQIIVLNRPGAGGLIAAQAAAAAENDGYTLYMSQASTFTVLPVEQEGKLTLNLQTAFASIGLVAEQPIAIAVNKDVRANNIAELIMLANNTPDGMLFGATNRGGQSHLTGELFRERAKAHISFVHGSAQGDRDPRRDRATANARHLHARPQPRSDRGVHSQRGAAVVADRPAHQPKGLNSR